MRKTLLAVMMAIATSTVGCGALVEAGLDRAFETKEERAVRKDKKRLRRGRPMKHHRDERDLRRHERALEDDDDC